MVKRRRKKSGPRIVFWVVTLLVIGALITGYRLWSCLINVTPQFNFILISEDNNTLKLLNGETLPLHPRKKLRILDISTNICFNQGIRLVAKGLDVNALLYEEVPLASLLPDKDIFDRYAFRLKVKHYNQDIGYVDFVVEPFVEDWLDKADRSIGSERKTALLERALKLVPQDKRIRDRLAREYISLKRWDDAALILEEMAKERPDQAVLYELLEIYEAMSKTDSIVSVLRRLIRLNPDDGDVRFRLAVTLEKAGLLKDAIKEYEGLLNRMAKEDLLPVYKTLGFLYTETNQIKKAISAYLKAVEMDKDDVNIYYNLSLLYEKVDQKDKADLFLGKAVELKSEDTEGRLKLSESLIKKDRLKEAETHLKEVLKRRPKSEGALLLMLNIAEKRGDKKGLKSVYQNILALDPKNTTIIYNLGIIEYETNNLSKALSYFKKYEKSYPEDSKVRAFLFDIYRRQKKDDLAFKEALTIIRLKPKEIDYYHFIFEYLNSRSNYREMIRVMKDGLKTHPKDTDLRKYLILAYLKTGKDDLAIEQIKEIFKETPNDIAILLQLARLQEKLERFEKALLTYKKIIDASPGHGEAKEAYLRLLLQLASLQEKQGRFEDAQVAYKKVMDISPGHEEAKEAYLRSLLQLAKLKERQEKFEEALATYKKIMDISPGHEEAEEAYLKLRLEILPNE
ncbi:tetratricopeptide repeat protein [Thermodesulfobacteriota bacterium]